jgi:glucose-6-phosphate isomerase
VVRNFFGAQTVVVVPYDQYLKQFPAFAAAHHEAMASTSHETLRA